MNGEVRKVETDGESRLVRPITIGWDRSPTIHNQLPLFIVARGGIRRLTIIGSPGGGLGEPRLLLLRSSP